MLMNERSYGSNIIGILLLCLFYLSIIYSIPILPCIYLPWPLWPTLNDFIIYAIVIYIIIKPFNISKILSHSNITTKLYISMAGYYILLSIFIFIIIFYAGLSSEYFTKQLEWGIYRIFKYILFAFVMLFVCNIARGIKILKILNIISIISIVSITSVNLAVYFFNIKLIYIAPHLNLLSFNNPWVIYKNASGLALGTLGYNHVVVGIIISIFIMLYYISKYKQSMIMDYIIITLSLALAIASRSRTSMVAILGIILMFTIFKKLKYKYVFIIIILLFIIVPAFGKYGYLTSSQNNLDMKAHSTKTTLMRHLELVDLSNSLNFIARLNIWSDKLEFLNENKLSFISGIGLGGSRIFGEGSHNLYLTYILETGIFGLVLFLLLMYKIIKDSLRNKKDSIYVIIITSMLLLISCFQETFIPGPAFGNVMCLYLATILISSNKESLI